MDHKSVCWFLFLEISSSPASEKLHFQVDVMRIFYCLHITRNPSNLLGQQCQQNYLLFFFKKKLLNYLVLVGLSVIWCGSHEKYQNLLKHWIVTEPKWLPVAAAATLSTPVSLLHCAEHLLEWLFWLEAAWHTMKKMNSVGTGYVALLHPPMVKESHFICREM